MTPLKKTGYSAFLIATVALLTACLPPAFLTFGILYAESGQDVPITVTITNTPSSATCLGGDVTLSNTSGNTWEGTVLSSSLSDGSNTIQCKATNSYGTTSQTIGEIYVVSGPPTLVTFTNVTVYDNDGTVAIDEPLVDTGSSSNLEGADYVYDASSTDSLPAGLSIDSSNGNLVGTIDVDSGGQSVTGVVLKATTVVGSDVNDASTTINIEDGAAP